MPKKLFQPGNPGGPGRPKLPADLHEVSILTRTEFEARASKFMAMPIKEIQELLRDGSQSALDTMIASIVYEASQGGDHQRLNFLLDRTIGKVVEKIETKHTHMIQRLEELEKLSDQELAHQAKAAMIALESKEEPENGS